MTMEKLETAEALEEIYQTPASKYDGTFSKTAQFMTPVIGINLNSKLVFSYFVNAFLTDMKHEHNYERPIFTLFSVKSFLDVNWSRVYNALIQSPNFITEYDVGTQNGNFLLMMVFQVPKEFEMDYINFKLGRYSKFSEEYKKKFPEFEEGGKKKNIHWQIINRDDNLKRLIEKEYNMQPGDLDDTCTHRYTGEQVPPAIEIWDKPNKKRENYRYEVRSE